MSIVVHGAARGDEGLRDRLAAEHTPGAFDLAPADETVAAARIEIEQQDQLSDEALGGRRLDGRSRHASRLARPRGGSQLMPGTRLRMRQAMAFAVLRAGHRRGGRGSKPRARSQAFSARASASAKLHSLRQVIESEIDGTGPFLT